MQAETNLTQLLKNMSPQLNEGAFVFCSVPIDFDTKNHTIIATFLEQEGKTLVLKQAAAQSLGLSSSSPMAWICLKVHSALEAVGLTAAFATALGKAGISCNVIAAYYHDHIFVPYEDRKKAVAVLEELRLDNQVIPRQI